MLLKSTLGPLISLAHPEIIQSPEVLDRSTEDRHLSPLLGSEGLLT